MKHVLDFLATWPLRYAVIASLLTLASLTIMSMIPRTARSAISLPAVNHSSSYDIITTAQRIADAHLFGQPVTQSDGDISIAATSIKIEGLLYSDDQSSALAILNLNGSSSAFKVGDMLPDGEKLAAIAPTAIQLTQGMTQRVVEIPKQFGSPGSGIYLAGATGLNQRTPPFPGLAPASGPQLQKPALRAASLPLNASPLDQLRSLRAQLIRH